VIGLKIMNKSSRKVLNYSRNGSDTGEMKNNVSSIYFFLD